ncbi:MAG: alpha/beta fold hydrolase [Oceanicaulis sp.]
MGLDLPDTLDFEGAPVRWGALGDPAAPPLVLIHGTPFSAQVWRRIAPWLARGRRVFYFDLVGYGLSQPGAPRDVSLGVQNRVLGALLDHWRLDRPEGLAHDFGAATALRAHLLDGRDFAALTLIDPVAIRPWGSPFVTHVRQHEAAFAGMPDYAHAALLDAYVQTAVHRPMRAEDLAVHTTPWRGALGQPAFYRQIAQMDQAFTDEIEARLGEVRCPVRLLWGMEDQWIPLETGRRVASLLKPDHFIEIPGAGHLVQEDAPEAILAAMAPAP